MAILQHGYKVLVMAIILTVAMAGAALAQNDSDQSGGWGDDANEATDSNPIVDGIKKLTGMDKETEESGNDFSKDFDDTVGSGSSSGGSTFQ